MLIPASIQKQLKKTFPDKRARDEFVERTLKGALKEHQKSVSEPVELFVDGGSRGNPGPGGGGFVVYTRSAEGAMTSSRLLLSGKQFFGTVTNNQAEYQALIYGLEQVEKNLGTPVIHCFMDSQLVVEQLSGRYKVKSPLVRPLFLEAQQQIDHFPAFKITHIPREKNSEADRLANEAMDDGY